MTEFTRGKRRICMVCAHDTTYSAWWCVTTRGPGLHGSRDIADGYEICYRCRRLRQINKSILRHRKRALFRYFRDMARGLVPRISISLERLIRREREDHLKLEIPHIYILD